ncbi:MAG TPA: hypothetical protein VFV72_12350 [Candidatus Limnocylindrales bacterium]|nr:hypothetical protein [Candidatus Limnocylindrales bacterium]
MTDDATASLEEVLAAAAANLEDAVTASAPSGGAEWSIDGRVFAAVASGRAEFRLDPLVANAALRTPDTSASQRGRDWVAFAPAEVDQHAIDRATAWLASAWRRADGEG